VVCIAVVVRGGLGEWEEAGTASEGMGGCALLGERRHPLWRCRGCQEVLFGDRRCCGSKHPLFWDRGHNGGYWDGGGAFEDLRNLDVGVGECGAVGEGRDGLGGGSLEEREHVSGCLSEVFVVCDLGEWNGVWEPVNSESVADAKCAGDIAFMAAVVL
jgi:hypothetical protein